MPAAVHCNCSPREGSSRPRTVACLGSRSPEFSNWSFLTAGPQEPTEISNKSDVIGIRYKYNLIILDIFGRELAAQLALSLIATLPFGSKGRGVGQTEIPLTPAPAYICILFVAEISDFFLKIWVQGLDGRVDAAEPSAGPKFATRRPVPAWQPIDSSFSPLDAGNWPSQLSRIQKWQDLTWASLKMDEPGI